MNFPLFRNKQSGFMEPVKSYYSDEYAQEHCDLYLSDELHEEGKKHNLIKYYRLHAKAPHSEDMALAYEIKCPKCGGILKQVGRTLDYNTLGLYKCTKCGNGAK